MEREKINIGFLGYGTRALDALMKHPDFEVKYFFTPKAGLCRQVYDAEKRYKDRVSMEIIYDNRQLAERFAQIQDVRCFLMNACPIILKQDALEHMQVFNVHPGDLHYNRGHQPHMWTVLLGEKETKLVLHTVGTAIDAGNIVKSVPVTVQDDDNAKTVLDRTEDNLPVLLDALYEHLTRGAPYEETVENGGYRRAMRYEDYEIKAGDSIEQVERKIRARATKHGAFVTWQGKRLYVDSLLSWKKGLYEGSCLEMVCRTKEEVYIYLNGNTVRFRLNKVEAIDEN